MDVEFIARVYPLYIEAGWVVVKLCFWGSLLSLIFGYICALVRYFRVPVARQIIGAYIELSRNTPLLIQLFFLYFGLPRLGLRMTSETCAIVGMVFLGGSYMAEAFRAGFEAVSTSQWEAAESIGLSKSQITLYIMLPQALAISMPQLSANIIFLLKETSVVSVVALADLMYIAKDLIGMYYKTNEALLLLVVAYLALILPLSLALRYVERRLRFAGFGN